MPIFIFTKERRKKLIKLKDTYEKIFETVWHNYTCGDVELNLLHFEFPVHAKKAELLEIYAKLVKTINGDDVVYLTNIQKFIDGHGRSYISGTVIDPDLSDFQDNFQGDFSEFLTSCFQGKKGWYRISQNDEVGKSPHRSVFGERLELII